MKIQRYKGVEGYDDRTLHLGGYSEKKQTYRNVKLFLIALLAICLFAALETTVFSHISLPWISSARPYLCLVFVLASGYVFGKNEGGVCGFIAGIAFECAIMEPLPGGIMVYPLIFSVLGYASGALAKIFLGENFFSFLVYVLIGSFIVGVMETIVAVMATGNFPAWTYFVKGLLPSMIITLPFAVPLYFPVLWGKGVLDK